MTNTRLSLYKLMLQTTRWVGLGPAEYRRCLLWLLHNGSKTARFNEVDRLYQTFLWFPTREGNHIYVPLGHMTRLFAQIDDRIPSSATSDNANVQLRNSLLRVRGELTGQQIMLMRSDFITAGGSQ